MSGYVPPRIGEDRVDTNQPMWAAQDPAISAAPTTIPFAAQSDDVPQKIELKRYRSKRLPYYSWRPHPLLCAGKLGMIDVLPDHPHEGWINETAEINLTANILINSVPAGMEPKEYPTVGGDQPKPEVIAWGNTPPAPPHIQEKGASPAKRFGIIGVYDGHRISLENDTKRVGRVVVDSTWHHWMSVNLSGEYEPGFDGDPNVPGQQDLIGLQEANNNHYKKILTYYRNTAVWLAPKLKQERMLAHVAFWSALSVSTFEEWRLDTPVYVLGKEGKDVLGRSIPACFVSRWVLDLIPKPFWPRIPEPFEKIDPRDPFGPICLSCPPIEDLEDIALGLLIRNMMSLRDKLLDNPKALANFKDGDFDKQLLSVFDDSRKETAELIFKKLDKEMERFSTATSIR